MAEALSITLYYAGRSLNSARALKQLERIGLEHGLDPDAVEYVDVFDQPQRALDDRVMLTPVLRIAFGDETSWLFGDLSDTRALLDVLKRASPDPA